MSSTALPRFKLVFYVPPSAVAACKSAVFAAGAGRDPGEGAYTECGAYRSFFYAFTTKGVGQFRPGDGAKPHIGVVGRLEEVEEVRVETLCCGREVVGRAVGALKRAHPYEEPAYEVFRMEDF